MIKQTAVHSHHEIPLSNKNSIDTTPEPENCTERKSQSQKVTSHMILFKNILEVTELQEWRTDWWVASV